jgi:hypothetical protein
METLQKIFTGVEKNQDFVRSMAGIGLASLTVSRPQPQLWRAGLGVATLYQVE